MNWLNKLKPTKVDAYIKGNAFPESDYETATGRALYTITAMRKAYDAGWDAALTQPTPIPANQPVADTRLTDEQISAILQAAIKNAQPLNMWTMDFARAIEAAHGIGDKT